MRRDVFQAIADPVRREIIQQVSTGTMTVNEVAGKFDISRPAISKHLKILNECGIIEVHKKGRERYCEIRPGNLIPAFLWLEQYQRLWEDKLDSFENYVMQLKKKKDEYTK